MPKSAHHHPLRSSQIERLQIEEEMQGKEPPAQIELANAFLKRYPQDPYANYVKAAAHFNANDKLTGIPFAQYAVQNGNCEPEYLSLLLRIYSEYRFFEQIEKVLVTAAKFPHTSSELEFHTGNYYSKIGQSESALKHLTRALSLAPRPDLETEIKSEMFNVFRNSNRNDEAFALLREFAKVEKTRPFALALLAQFAPAQESPELESEILSALDSPTLELSAEEKAKLFLGLGWLQEKRKDYSAAFGSWQRSRDLAAIKYSRTTVEHDLKDAKQFYTVEMFERMRPFSNPSEAPIIVFGMPRSGTTLVAQILSAHPDAASAGEIARLPREAANLIEHYFVPRGLKRLITDAEQGEIAERANDFLRVSEVMAGRKAKHYVDKTPTQFLYAGYIHLCFYKAHFINVVRNPADIFISTYQNDFMPNFTYAFSQESFAHYYLQRELFISHWKKLFGDLILDVRYEDLTADPEAQIRRMLDFLGLEWDPACLRFFERPAMINTFSRDQVRSSINTKSVGRWRNYQAHLGPLLEALQKGGVENLS